MSPIVSGSTDEIRECSRFIVFVWIICRQMGLIPLTIRISKENGRMVWIASYSRGWTIYSWGVLAFTVSMSFLGIHKMIWTRKDITTVLASIVTLNVSLMNLTTLVGVGRSGTHAKNLIKARKLIEKAQSIISWSKNIRISSKYYKKMSTFYLFIWIVNLITGIVTQLRGGKETRKPVLFSLFYAGTNVIIYFMVLNFTNVVNSMMHTIVQVNDTLKQIQKDENTISGGYGDLRTKLSTVIEARFLIGEAGLILSKDQSPATLVMLLSITFRAVIISNSAIFESGFPGREFYAAFQVLSCFAEIVKLIWIVESCHYISKAANQTKEDITKLLMLVWDIGLRSDLKHCLRQIIEHPTEFTAMGVWTIDRSLIGTVFGLVLTNLIMLAQFSD